ncbi:MAG: DUF1292 domain-containing protein [Lachnospiraceae bacterium]|nr:DUF1292 domain-containing protein [Lachnospiraceae bacterium]
MSKKPETIILTGDEGFEIELEVLEQTTIAGRTYILVFDAEEEEVFLMREVQEDGEYVSYELVEDEEEIDSIMKVFSELIDEFDLEW